MSDHITISDSSQWPPQVSTISHYLTNDLPPSLLSAQPTLSPRASHLWTEVTKRYPSSTSHEDLPHELVDIMDTLLSTVSIIRTLRHSNATSRETRPFVSLLLYALLRFCYPDAHVSENVRFARSYLDKVGNMTVGDATMLASVISPLSNHLSNDVMLTDPVSTETAVDDTDDTRSEGSRSADTSVSSHSSIKSVPPNAHVYDYWHDRRSVAFPFVCVADEHSIFQVLKSTTYQRITWDVQDPVIGIALSENGVSARFYFAWTDQHPHGSAMPPVHCVSSSNSAPLDGAFDFSAPDSTLLFASFLLSLRPLYHALVQQCCIAHCSDFTWRADSKSDDQKGPPESWEGKISMWVHHVQSDFSTSKEVQATSSQSSSKSASRSLSDVSKSSAGSTPSNEPQRSNSSRPSSRLAQNQVTPDNQITRPPPGDNVIRGRQKERAQEKGSNSSTKARSSSERSTSRLAASKLCARSEKGISGDDLSIGSILYDRNVIEVSRIRLATDDTSLSNAALPDKPSTETRALIEEINEVIEGYDALTGYKPLPAKFSVLAESILTPICEVFTAQIKAFEDARQNLDNEDFLIPNEIASATFEPLDEADSSQISESLSLLLWTVESARRVNASVGTGNEAEARLCWDVLIYLSFTGPSENVSTRVLLERMLPLPFNPAADCVASGKADVLKAFAHASLKRTKIKRDLCSAAYVLGPRLTADVRLQFEAAFAASYARQAEVKQFLRGDYAKLILERAEHETDKAKCDCIIAFPAPRLEKSLQHPFLQLRQGVSAPSVPPCLTERLPVIDEDKKLTSKPSHHPSAAATSSPSQGETDKTRVNEVSPYTANPASFQMTKLSGELGERLKRGTSELSGKPLLPVFLGEYKKLNESPMKAVRQLKLYLVSAVVFLASMGFKKQPVYGLATNGTVGVILCCWYSEVDDIVFMMDRNVRSFDISSPIEMYQFATFMLRLRKWSDNALAQLVEEHLGTLNQSEQKKWTKMEQDEALFPDRKQSQTTTTTTGAAPHNDVAE